MAKGKSAYGERAKGFLGEEISHHVRDKGMPQDQAVAAAMSEARRKGLKVPRDTQATRKRAPKKKAARKKPAAKKKGARKKKR